MSDTRDFGNGATRDTSKGKLEYIGFRHPLLEHLFAQYMDKHRNMPDGSRRESNNWWNGWDKRISLDSMTRHVADLEAIHAGYRVFKERVDGAEYTHLLKEGDTPRAEWKEVTESDTCNAIRFNAMAYLLQVVS